MMAQENLVSLFRRQQVKKKKLTAGQFCRRISEVCGELVKGVSTTSQSQIIDHYSILMQNSMCDRLKSIKNTPSDL